MKRLIILLCSALIAACGTTTPSKETYLPLIERSEPSHAVQFKGTLQINAFSAQAPFGERSFFYRESAQRFIKDPYREWLSAPTGLITSRVQTWLKSSGLFSEVLPLSSKQNADYQLSGELLTLHTDLQAQPIAVAKLHIRLSSAKSPVILDTILTASEPLSGTSANDIAAGLDKALASTLKQLESKLISPPTS
jgi:cholesterol transport system auxiliary component